MGTDDGTDDLLLRYSAGDADAAMLLFSRHRTRLKRMVAARMDPRLVGRIDPSDVVQDTLVDAVRRLSDYLENRPIAFYPWLRQIAWNRMVDLYRKHRLAGRRSTDREVHSVTMLSPNSLGSLTGRLLSRETNPYQKVATEESVQQVKDALERLAAKDAEIVILRHIEQLSVSETAEILAIAEGTVKSRHYRALLRLRNMLADSGQWDDR